MSLEVVDQGPWVLLPICYKLFTAFMATPWSWQVYLLRIKSTETSEVLTILQNLTTFFLPSSLLPAEESTQLLGAYTISLS